MKQVRDHFESSFVILMIALLASALGSAQAAPPVDVEGLVRRAANNEIKANNVQAYFMYRDHTQYKTHSITKEVIETPQGGLSSTITQNGQPLSAEQRAKEDQKLKKFAYDSETRRKKEQQSKEEDKRAELMLTSLPDAFLYTYTGTVKGPDGRELVQLRFKPNPKFAPPNHETQVYVGMEGEMLIDPKAARIAKLDGTLFRDVEFGWGILGRLYKGGKFLIEQRDVGASKWEMTRERLQFEGKILMVKPLHIDSEETMTDFRQVSATITTDQALNLLHKSTDTIAENAPAKEPDNNH